MKYPVFVHPRVEEFLDSNAKWWTENRSVEQAERWYDGIVAAIRSLSKNPERFPLAQENDEFPYEVRALPFGLSTRPTHRVLYTIRPDRVYVFCIRHVAQKPLSPEDLSG